MLIKIVKINTVIVLVWDGLVINALNLTDGIHAMSAWIRN